MPDSNELLSAGAQLIGMPLAGPESFSQQQLDYLKAAMGIDETVLWSGTATNSCSLSEAPSNFEQLKLTLKDINGKSTDVILGPTSATTWPANIPGYGPSGAGITFFWIELSGTTLTVIKAKGMTTNFADNNANWGYDTSSALKNAILKVVGIHRIAGGN